MKKISWLTIITLLAIVSSAVRIVYLFLIDLFKFPENFLDYIDYTIVGLVILILVFWIDYRKKQANEQERLRAEMEAKRREDFQIALAKQKSAESKVDTAQMPKIPKN